MVRKLDGLEISEAKGCRYQGALEIMKGVKPEKKGNIRRLGLRTRSCLDYFKIG